MPTNFYIKSFDSTPEQRLIEDLIEESIKFYGIDVYWLPRTLVEKDEIYGEDTLSKFTRAIPIEMYIKNVEGFEGEGDFLSRFGLEIRDQMVFTVSIRRFTDIINEHGYSPQTRPYEGDLIWFPLARRNTGHMFELKFVEHESMFYPRGTLPVYDLRCESFGYSNEIIATGNENIDTIYTAAAARYLANTMPSGPGDDNVTIEAEANTNLETTTSPFGDF